jgi:hypothetical protein
LVLFILQDRKISLRKRNVVGCYLAQELPYIRFSTDVLGRAKLILYKSNGKFSKDEDEVILAEVKKNGTGIETWQKLAKILKRNSPRTMRRRYESKLKEVSYISGAYTIEEDKLILEQLFQGKKEVGIADIKASQQKSLLPAVSKLYRPISNINMHWLHKLKPVLLSYHLGVLHFDWKESFANYIVDKKPMTMQEVDWKDAVEHFPGQSSASLKTCLNGWTTHRMTTNKDLPLFEALRLHLPQIKETKDQETTKTYREEIVRIYKEIRKR